MSTVIYRCLSCGAPLALNPKTGDFDCEYCLSHYTLEQIQKEGPDNSNGNQAGGKDSKQGENLNQYSCPSCGASVVTSDTTAATFCYYCHSPVILSGRLVNEYKPSQIIPFSIDQKSAKEIFINWCKGKKFLTRDFLSEKNIEKMTGIYFPYWLVDNNLDCSYTAQSTKTKVMVVGDIETTETTFYEHKRVGKSELVDIPAVALKNANEGLLNSLYPYHNKEIKPFNMSYLTGFFAESFDKTKDDVSPTIERQIERYAKKLVCDTLPSGTLVTREDFNYNVNEQNWDFTLLPAWILTYKYNDKIYMFGVNAQTGKVSGELPVDRLKLALWTAGSAVAAFVAAGFLGGVVFA